MTRHYRDVGSASDWLNQISHAAWPIRSTTQICVVTRHQYGISAHVSQTSLCGETSGSVAKCRLFSQANHLTMRWASSLPKRELHKGIYYCLGIWIPCHRFRIPGLYSGILCQWNLDSGLQSWASRFLKLYSGFQSPEFRISQAKIFRIPESLTWVGSVEVQTVQFSFKFEMTAEWKHQDVSIWSKYTSHMLQWKRTC